MKNIRRFTLIELLAVMALIAILSGLGFGVYSYAKGKAKQSATEALLKQIEAGLGAFNTKAGYYPRSNGGDFSVIKFTFADDGTVASVNFGGETLTRETGTSPTKEQRMKNERFEAFAKTVDMEAIKNSLNAQNELVDAWGNPIYYRSPGQFKQGGYDLVSAGPDGGFGTEKKDTPAGITDLGKFRETAGEHVCDDVFNF